MYASKISREPIVHVSDIGNFDITQKEFGRQNIAAVAEHLRFLYSPEPMELTTGNAVQFVTERSAIKVHPNTEVLLNMERSAKVYEIQFYTDEQQTLDQLKDQNRYFFNSLRGEDKKDWESVANAGLDHIMADEPHAEHMQRLPGIIIAPPYARFKNNIGNGWHFMYARGSKLLSIGSDMNFSMRPQEAEHKHGITTEFYICLGGSLELLINDEKRILKEGDFVAAHPGDVHKMESFPTTPYKGLTIQSPSLPGDKYTRDGTRIERYLKK